jgi:hypothetical protein
LYCVTTYGGTLPGGRKQLELQTAGREYRLNMMLSDGYRAGEEQEKNQEFKEERLGKVHVDGSRTSLAHSGVILECGTLLVLRGT